MPQSQLAAVDPAARLTRWKEILRETDWPSSGTLVAVDGNRVMGFSRIRPAGGVDRETTGEVGAFHVSPDHLRQGIGRTLMGVTLPHLANAGFDNAILWVVHGNGPAIHFYEAMRWRLDGTHRYEISKALNGYVVQEIRMARQLP